MRNDLIRSSTLVDLLLARAGRQPDRRSYVFLRDGETDEAVLTCGELERQARAIAAALVEAGAAGRPVLLCHEQGLDYVAAFFGCLFAGAIAVPAYPPEPGRLSKMLPRLQAVARDAGARFVLTSGARLEGARALVREAAGLGDAVWLASDELAAGDAGAWRHPGGSADDLAFLMYTSGSTGEPKGVMVSHRNALYNVAEFPGFLHRPCEGLVFWAPFFHDLGMFFGILHPLYQGVLSVLLSPAAYVQRPFRWFQAISRYRATATGGPNFAYDLSVSRMRPEERDTLDLSCLNLALNGAEPVRRVTLERMVRVLGPVGFRPEALYPSFGMAEAAATVTGPGPLQETVVRSLDRREIERGRVAEAAGDGAAMVLVGLGGGLAGQTIAVVSPETRTRCAPGVVGEIWVSGPSIARGYWNRPEETEESLCARLADTGEGPFLRTGDLGFLADGELFVAGRLKDLIILRGVNHHPEDLEVTVEGCNPALRPSLGAAFAVEEDGQERLAIAWEVQPAPGLDLERIVGDIRQAVAEVHEVEVWAVELLEPRAIPKTSSGKIQRRTCAAAFAAGSFPAVLRWRAPRAAETAGAAEGTEDAGAAATAAEIRDWLVGHLAGRLGLDPARVDVREPFSRFGLGSIEALGLVGELERRLGQSLPPTLVWDFPTIEALARRLASAGMAGAAAGRWESSAAPLAGEPVAIVGMGCRFPGAPGVDAYWRLLREGREAVADAPPDGRWDPDALCHPDPAVPGKMLSRRGGFLDGLDLFDARFFGISPREAEHLDPRQRLLLEVAWEALEDAGIPPHSLAGSATGVFIATLTNDFDALLSEDLRRLGAYTGSGTANTIVANRLSYFFDLAGPSVSLDTACSGSLVALHLACQSLRSGESSMALVGGVNLILLPKGNIFFTKAGALSPDGRCQVFDARANGIVRGDGAGLLVLKPLSRAVADGDRIHAVIRGSAVNSDGRSNGLMAPNGQAQERLLRAACRQAGVDPSEVQYVEAHGTGTHLGDPIEARALGAVLGTGRPPERPCAVGSVKTNLGHLEAAAGVAGVIKVALALRERLLPPSLNFATPNPLIPFAELALRVQQEAGPWPAPDRPLVAGVSSFGIGGTNAHVVLAEAPPAAGAEPEPAGEVRLLPLSAHLPEALGGLAAAWRGLAAAGEPAFAAACRTAAVGRSPLDHRMALVAASWEEAAGHLDAFLAGAESPGLSRGERPLSQAPRLVFAFSGQGAHWLGMGRELAAREPVFRAVLERCDQLLRESVDWSLLEELSAGAEQSRLDRTEVTQPAVFAIQAALAALWHSWGLVPDAVVGQSLGEVAAAYVAGALRLEDALRVVVWRSRLMQRVAGQGKTALVALPLAQARLVLTGSEDLVAVAGTASPASSVLSGDPATLERILRSLERQGVFCRFLKGVDVAFHSPQMDPLCGELEAALAGLVPRSSRVPMVSTVTGDVLDGSALDAAYWARNLREPFLFAEAVRCLAETGHRLFLEVGPHPVLAPSILEGLRHLGCAGTVVPSLRRGEDERRVLLGSLGSLWTQGVAVDWRRLHPQGGTVASLPHYPWQRERFWFTQGGLAGEAAPAARRRPGLHPLLGEHLHSALLPEQHFWELDLGASSLPYLADHRVRGTVVMPGAAYVEMALAAAGELAAGPLRVEDVVFRQPLWLTEEATRRVQLALTQEADGAAAFRICSRSAAEGAGDWTVHVEGRVVSGAAAGTAPERLPLEDVRARCAEEVGGAELYRRLASQGLSYGPSFRGIESVRRRPGEALARLRVPAELAGEAALYRLHPALLDAAFQSVAATEEGGTGEETFLPAGVGAVRVFGRLEGSFECHAVLRSGAAADAAVRVADVTLLDAAGTPAAQVLGLRLQRVGAGAGREDLASWLHELEWHAVARGETKPAAGSGVWLVLAGAGAPGEALAARLEERGFTAVVVAPGDGWEVAADGRRVRLAPNRPELFERLLRELPGGAAACRGAVHLWGLEIPGPEPLPEAATLGCGSVLSLLRALAQSESLRRPPLWLVTRGGQLLDGEAPADPAAAAQATLWGLGRVISLEHPELWGGMVDLDPASGAEEAAAGLAAEILGPDGEDQIALRGGGRRVARLVHAAPVRPGEAVRFRPDASYLITGGFSGLGLATARWMASRGARRLILLGRTPLPPRSAWRQFQEAGGAAAERIAAVLELEALGVSVHPAAADVADREALREIFDRHAREGWPAIRGVIHSAGVVEDQLLLRLEPASLAAVLRPKVLGAWLLHDLLWDAPLDHFVLFSSASSLLPPPGQGSYAAGNAFLDALARHRRALGLPAVSIGWGPWSEVGMAARAGLERQHTGGGMRMISPEQGLEVLERLLGRGAPAQVAVLPVDWSRWRNVPLLALLRRAEQPGAGSAGTREEAALLQEVLLAAGPDERRALLEARLAEMAAGVMRTSPSRLDPHQPFAALGMDSIMGVELKNRIEVQLGLAVSLADLLMGGGIAQLASRLLPQIADEAGLAELLAEVEGLSAEEARALLGEEGGEIRSMNARR